MKTETGWKLPIIDEYHSFIRLVRQIVPTKFATGYFRNGQDAIFSTWWMWLGNCYKIKETNLSKFDVS